MHEDQSENLLDFHSVQRLVRPIYECINPIITQTNYINHLKYVHEKLLMFNLVVLT
jgi:hypothetical protein